MKPKKIKFIADSVIFILALFFLIKVGGAPLLRLYVQSGIGDCRKVPVLCVSPQPDSISPQIERNYLNGLTAYKFPKMQALLPKGFDVIQEEIKKPYYAKGALRHSGPAVYIFYQKPGFFIELFPQMEKLAIITNYVFIGRVMHARQEKIKNLSDTFFIIMKAIFTPNLGAEDNIKIINFIMPGHKGYITYNMGELENYFACDVIDGEDGFFKMYIKDKHKELDLEKVLTIISTLKKAS